jgi:hypothetical protein
MDQPDVTSAEAEAPDAAGPDRAAAGTGAEADVEPVVGVDAAVPVRPESATDADDEPSGDRPGPAPPGAIVGSHPAADPAGPPGPTVEVEPAAEDDGNLDVEAAQADPVAAAVDTAEAEPATPVELPLEAQAEPAAAARDHEAAGAPPVEAHEVEPLLDEPIDEPDSAARHGEQIDPTGKPGELPDEPEHLLDQPDDGSASPGPRSADAPPAPSARVDVGPARLIPGSALVGVVIGLWAVAPNFTGPGLVLRDPSVEVLDHVVPGLAVVAVSIGALVVAWSAARPGPLLFLVGGAVATAGLWMVATHVPLFLQAVQGEVSWGATLYHLAPSAATLWLGIDWMVRYWSDWLDPA